MQGNSAAAAIIMIICLLLLVCIVVCEFELIAADLELHMRPYYEYGSPDVERLVFEVHLPEMLIISDSITPQDSLLEFSLPDGAVYTVCLAAVDSAQNYSTCRKDTIDLIRPIMPAGFFVKRKAK